MPRGAQDRIHSVHSDEEPVGIIADDLRLRRRHVRHQVIAVCLVAEPGTQAGLKHGSLEQIAERVVLVNGLRSVGRDDPGNVAVGAAFDRNHRAVGRGDAAVGPHQALAGRAVDFAQSVGDRVIILRAVRRRDTVVETAEAPGGRVIGQARADLEECVAHLLQHRRTAGQREGNAGIGCPDRMVIRSIGAVNRLRIKSEASAGAVGQRDINARAGREGGVVAVGLLPRRGNVRGDVGIGQDELPAVAKGSRLLGIQAGIAPRDRNGDAVERDREIRLQPGVGAGLGRRVDLDRALHRRNETADVGGG